LINKVLLINLLGIKRAFNITAKDYTRCGVTDSPLASVLLMDIEAALEAEGLHSWLVLPVVAALPRDVVFDAKELPIRVVDGESDPTTSANVL